MYWKIPSFLSVLVANVSSVAGSKRLLGRTSLLYRRDWLSGSVCSTGIIAWEKLVVLWFSIPPISEPLDYPSNQWYECYCKRDVEILIPTLGDLVRWQFRIIVDHKSGSIASFCGEVSRKAKLVWKCHRCEYRFKDPNWSPIFGTIIWIIYQIQVIWNEIIWILLMLEKNRLGSAWTEW